jgi:3-hydroxyacyl-[acyl-carrier-protein] dehydratase
MWHSREVRFSIDHPTAAGHFPGNPIIPGAVLLDEVLQAIAGDEDVGPSVIRSAKFLRPVRPGDGLLIRWQNAARGETKFECRLLDPERLALVGTVQRVAASR